MFAKKIMILVFISFIPLISAGTASGWPCDKPELQSQSQPQPQPQPDAIDQFNQNAAQRNNCLNSCANRANADLSRCPTGEYLNPITLEFEIGPEPTCAQYVDSQYQQCSDNCYNTYGTGQ